MKVLCSSSYDVYQNLALEEHLFSKGEEVLFLWVNAPSVIVGYHQNTYQEVNLPYLEEQGIALARRLTGGGAVYHDFGNLNVSLITRQGNELKLNDLLLKVLSSFGLKAIETPNNDLLINGKKFCGQASFEARGVNLTHACLLVNANLEVLEKALHPSPLKLASHSVDSVRSRVTNLSSLCPSLTVETLKDAFCSLPGMSPYKEKLPLQELEEGRKKFQDAEFIFGRNPPFDYEAEMEFHHDIVTVRFKVEDGIIIDVKWYSDGERNPTYAQELESYKGKRFEDLTIPSLHFSTFHSRR